MKTAFINLPYPRRLVRRYTCSYHAPNFLFPPLELMYLAAIAKKWKQESPLLLDAVAERLTGEQVCQRLANFKPQLLVCLLGLETFGEDLKVLQGLKERFPGCRVACLGHLPTVFPADILRQIPFVDFLLMGEPEQGFSLLYDALNSGGGREDQIPGLAWRRGDEIVLNPLAERLRDIDIVPFPARELLDTKHYYEFFLPAPLTTIQSSRGCPATCTYCVRTFGQKVGFRSTENIIQELKEAVDRYGARSIRFIDDNFCMDKKRVRAVCEGILKGNIHVSWVCLSRVDSLDAQTVQLMKQAGCRRIFLGIETFSQRLLDIYKKQSQGVEAQEAVSMIRSCGVEVVGFFMLAPFETREEFEGDVRQAIALDLDYIVVEKLTPYPGTPLFDEMKESIEFSLFPYTNRLKDKAREAELVAWEKEFYRRFYLRAGYGFKMFPKILSYPRQAWHSLKELWQYSSQPLPAAAPRSDLV